METAVVYFETAQELFAAEYPQPIPEKGQVWYSPFKAKIVVETPEDNEGFVSASMDGNPMKAKRELFGTEYIYAPTTANLRNDMFPPGTNERLTPVRVKFAEVETGASEYTDNPDAYADSWIKRNGKTNKQ